MTEPSSTGPSGTGPDDAGQPDDETFIRQRVAQTWNEAQRERLEALVYVPTPEELARRDLPFAERIDEITDLLASLDLYLGRHEWKQLTTEQKELLADMVDEGSRAAFEADEARAPGDSARAVERWWRADYVEPTD